MWGSRVSASTISDLNQKAYVHIEEWRNRKLSGKYPYVYVDGIYLKRNWGGEFENVSILVAIGVDEDGYGAIVRELNRIGNNINQIAAKQHSHGFVDEPMLREAVVSLQRMEREFTRAFAQES